MSRLTFEPLLPDHLDELAPVLLRAPVYAHIEPQLPSLEEFRLGLLRAIEGPGPQAAGQVWINILVRWADTGQVVGRVEATLHDDLAEVAFLLGDQFWGQGLGRECLEWLHGHLQVDHRVTECWATTVPANGRCQSLLQACGYLPAVPPFPRLLSYDVGDLVFVRTLSSGSVPRDPSSKATA